MARWPTYSDHSSGLSLNPIPNPVLTTGDTMHIEITGDATAFHEALEKLMTPTAVVTPPDYHNWRESAGPWCNDHRSLYCEHSLDFIGQRTDVPYISRAITGAPSHPDLTDGYLDGDDEVQQADLHMVVPVYPEYCIWEQLYYEVKELGALGYVAELSPDYKKKKGLQGVRRLMPGESAADLALTLRQQFEDDLDYYHEALTSTSPSQGAPRWMRCKSTVHSFKYNQMATKIASPHVIKGAIEDNRDRVLVYANLYCYMRHERCMFCYVNENFRDAVRVNPELAGYMGELLGGDNSELNNFEDLVP